MYLKNKVLMALKVKNVLLVIFSVFEFIFSGYVALDLLIYYRDDLDTALHAKAMPDCINGLITAVVVLLVVAISRKLIGDARFYSSYFEGDLDGKIKISDLAGVAGHSETRVGLELSLFRLIYMKKFEIKTIDGVKQVELFSKKTLCECKNCGAAIEKKQYFTGQCPYCGSPDIYAKVLAGDRFYSISNEVEKGVNHPDYYEATALAAKKALAFVLIIVAVAILVLFGILLFDSITKYNDQEYLKKVLLDPESGLRSFALIKADIMHKIVMAGVFILVALILMTRRIKSIGPINISESCANFFSSCKVPFIHAEEVPVVKSSGKKKIGAVRGAIRKGYLKHCTLEMHDSVLQVALAKKIVKDHCPSCASPISGAVDENYTCQYCGNKIMGVIVKK